MWKKGQIPWNKGIPGLAGKDNPHWKGGNSRCLVCDKLLASRYAKHCREHRPTTKKTRMIHRKQMLGNTFRKGINPWNKGIPYLAIQGDKNPNWGKFGPAHPKWTGKTPLRKSLRDCKPYKDWRIAIFRRDNYTCQICRVHGGYLEADHYPDGFAYIIQKNNINTFKDGIKCKSLWDISNGRTLCRKCHDKTRPVNLRFKDKPILTY